MVLDHEIAGSIPVKATVGGYMQTQWFTADEHYGHANIIEFADRGVERKFVSTEEMDEELIKRNNEIVGKRDIVYHLGDFCWDKRERALEILSRLKGDHRFLVGNHDRWMKKNEYPHLIEISPWGQSIVLSHYAMRVWNKSHFNSWNLYGHSHGMLPGIGKQMDVGVDTNNYYPYSFQQIVEIMEKKENNINFLAYEGRR